MTHTSTEQPEALRLAECLERDTEMNWPDYDNQVNSAAELRRLHARVQELEAQIAHMADLVELVDYATKKLEASQAQRVPLSDEEIFNIYCQSDSELNTTTTNLTLFARAIESAHGIGKDKA
jgi:hypothetical protein